MLQNLLNILKNTEANTLKGQILYDVNYISIKFAKNPDSLSYCYFITRQKKSCDITLVCLTDIGQGKSNLP